MQHEIKIVIQKQKPVPNPRSDWKRFYLVEKLKLDDWCSIQTEAQLCEYIYRRFGEGRYMCTAIQKGHKGFWVYWIGGLYSNGFIRDTKRDREVETLRREFSRSDSLEERELIQEDIQLAREIAEEKAARARAPCYGLIKFRPGILHGYSEELDEAQREAYRRKMDSARRRY